MENNRIKQITWRWRNYTKFVWSVDSINFASNGSIKHKFFECNYVRFSGKWNTFVSCLNSFRPEEKNISFRLFEILQERYISKFDAAVHLGEKLLMVLRIVGK